MYRVVCAAVLAVLCAFVLVGGAAAQGRTSIVVAPVIRESTATLPTAYSPDILRREIETALEATGLFTVPMRNRPELDAVVKEVVLTGRRGARPIPGQYILTTTVMAGELDVRRREAPNNRQRDLTVVSGSLALRVTVMRASDAGVKARMSVNVTYVGEPSLTDPSGPLGPGGARHDAGTNSDFVGLSQAAGKALAKRVLDQVNPVVVIQRTGDEIWLSRGEDGGYAIGDILRIMKVGAELRHPVTGEVLDRSDRQIGEARVVEVRPRVSIARILRSTEDIGAGAIVRESLDAEQ